MLGFMQRRHVLLLLVGLLQELFPMRLEYSCEASHWLQHAMFFAGSLQALAQA